MVHALQAIAFREAASMSASREMCAQAVRPLTLMKGATIQAMPGGAHRHDRYIRVGSSQYGDHPMATTL